VDLYISLQYDFTVLMLICISCKYSLQTFLLKHPNPSLFIPSDRPTENRPIFLTLSGLRLIYKMILKPIWTNGKQLWGTASTSNVEILERFQSKALRMIVDAPWYMPNTIIRRDLQTPTVKEEIRRYSSQYSARLGAHPNGLVVNLMELPDNRRLRRHLSNDLPTRFLV
jgi:carbonic anhydrase